MKIEKELLEQYNVAVPRYTSYPPANHFPEMEETTFRNLIVESNRQEPAHIAFYVHIPFCTKICHYCGCHALSLGKGAQVKPYFEALKREIAMALPLLDRSRKVSQIHFGGGTPNAVDVEYLKEIVALFAENFTFIDDAEIAIECNPAYLHELDIVRLKQSGFNRFSIGIQDFDRTVLKLVNREPSAIPAAKLVELLKDGSPKVSVNLDFIYGLPGQTPQSFEATIRTAAALRPDRLVIFSYAHVPWLKKHQGILERHGLPTADEKMEMFMAAYRYLTAEGYQHLGFDHFVLPHDELHQAFRNHLLHRNFQGYCSRRTTGQVYAFGVSAISQLAGAYAQNVKAIEPYIRLVGQGRLPVEKGLQLTHREVITREVINELMCNRVVTWSSLAAFAGVGEPEIRAIYLKNQSSFEQFVRDGLIEMDEHKIVVTAKGSFFVRNIAAALDPAFTPADNKHSKAV